MPSLEYYAPAPELRDYVSVYYHFDCPEAEFTDIERAALAQVRFLLVGEADLEFADGHKVHTKGPVLLGPTTGFYRFSIKGPFRMFGMGLLPAGWGAATSRSAADVADRAVCAEEFWPEAGDYLEQLRNAKTVQAMVTGANAILQGLVDLSSPDILTFTKMVDGWLAADPSPSVPELRTMTGLSDRQLARKVKQYYGVPPKYLSRKYRALRAARAMVDANDDDADYLRDAFYDQSHMIRELKIFAGMTPNELRYREGVVAKLIDQRSQFDGEISDLTTLT
ncbi:helix-turn-helix domain-containing protein [Alterisphingorhabdus coralli]|uniref:Helix-turn-helix domain-containing protein n=1 Tax=Alterisphingorhabdus coralli TaxID=3071408 RepID=A0AA97F6W5_9SPHN|nr:helix-turn-helix domain-containing protein [Parasphingorhabdus sp. SCSIO 66989]WOE75311.1 helix-turn-helix domain-containing protein [Parasphingorhabdus sp. SCSIO 66989]